MRFSRFSPVLILIFLLCRQFHVVFIYFFGHAACTNMNFIMQTARPTRWYCIRTHILSTKLVVQMNVSPFSPFLFLFNDKWRGVGAIDTRVNLMEITYAIHRWYVWFLCAILLHWSNESEQCMGSFLDIILKCSKTGAIRSNVVGREPRFSSPDM